MSPLHLLLLLLSIALVLFGLMLGIRLIVRHAKWRGRRCQWCGYDLGERSNLRCPECGLEEDVRSWRSHLRLIYSLAFCAMPIMLGGVLIGSLGPHAFGPAYWSVMPNGMLIRFSFGPSPSLAAREELERRMRPVPTGGITALRHMHAPIDPAAFTPEQWDQIATAILDDIERVDARPLVPSSQGLLSHAEWLLYIPADVDRIRDRVAELFEHGGEGARKNTFWLIYGGHSQFAPDPQRWVMDDRLCPLLVERMLNDPEYYGCQGTSTLFASLCRCHWESIERYLREGSDEMHALPNQHPTRFTSFFSVRTPEDVQGMFLFIERMLDDEDPAMLRHREHFERSYAVLRRGRFGQVVYVNGVMQDGRWSFVPKTRAELEAEGVGGEGGVGDGGDG